MANSFIARFLTLALWSFVYNVRAGALPVKAMSSFQFCNRCNAIFEDEFRIGVCPDCIKKFGKDKEFRKKLSVVRNFIKDQEIKKILFTVQSLAEQTEVSEEEIWIFIRMGEIDTFSFDDPHVREYRINAKRAIEKRSRDAQPDLADELQQSYRGYHSRKRED